MLAGTILMGAGVSGSGPSYHDSTVTLSKLVPRIARYRDAFYQRLLKALPGPHGERLREEAEKRQQPFAGVRQYLNQAIATQRAAHLQDRRLAQLYAAMGYPTAAREQAAKISAPAVRFGTEIRIRQTEAGFAADRNEPADAATLLGEVEDLLRRGIDCGALIDPWNILGYQGLFPIFPGREDTVRDPRAEELIHQIGRQFDLYAKATAAAAVAGDEATRERLIDRDARPRRVVGQVRHGDRHRHAARGRRRAGRRGRARRRRAGRVVEARAQLERRRRSGGSTARGSPARPRSPR